MEAVLSKLLTRRQIEACVMYYVQGHDQKRVAEMLGISQSRVSERLANANKRIRARGLQPLKRNARGATRSPRQLIESYI
jgi:RNA polymerase sigma factor (sigma-70 family)